MKNYLLLILLFLTAFVACQRNTLIDPLIELPVGNIIPIEYDEADYRNWFNSEFNRVLKPNNPKNQLLREQIVPQWDNAMLFKIEDKLMLVAPIPFKDEYKTNNKINERFLLIEESKLAKTRSGSIIVTNIDHSLTVNEMLLTYLSHQSKKTISIDGRITILDLGYNLIEYADYQDGKQRTSGVVSTNPHRPYFDNGIDGNSVNSTSGCTEWYLVYYANGVEIGSIYLGTTCDCEYTRQGARAMVISDCSNGGGSGGGGGPNDIWTSPPGRKPYSNWTFPCLFSNDMWSRSVAAHKEYFGVITLDGTYLVTQELDKNGGKLNGIDRYNGQPVYYWPVSSETTIPTYPNVQVIYIYGVAHYMIPIAATVHSHPCVDNDYCFNYTLSSEDIDLASKYSDLRHWVVADDGKVARYDPSGFFNINICNTLY